jgi:hypothetical protein
MKRYIVMYEGHNGSISHLLEYYININIWCEESVSVVEIRISKVDVESNMEN